MVNNGCYISFRIFFLLIFNMGMAQVLPTVDENSKNDTISTTMIVETVGDTVQVTRTNERLQAVIDYTSEEQYHDVKNKFTYLVDNAEVTYQDTNIKADYIEINWDTGAMYAIGKQDSLGNIIEPSIFTQGGRSVEYNSFVYNVNTRQGKAFNVRTEESMGGEKGVIVAGVVRQYNDSISGMRKIAYTTDTYFIERKDSIADYHMESEIAKYIRGTDNKIITGPIVMKIYNVTTPLALPFAFLPLGENRSTGLLMPSFGERQDVGFFIQGAGIYLPIGEYIDIALTGDVYTRGSYGLHAVSQYTKRYSFGGNFRFDWEKVVTGIQGLDNYSQAKLFRLLWSHRQDPKANPNLIFSANVNFSSSQYFRNGINNMNLINGDVLTNTTSSNISVNRTFPNTPFSASLNLQHNQNNSSQVGSNPVTFNIPTLAVNMNRIFPFARAGEPKRGLIKNLGMTYNFNLQNTIYTNDQELFTDLMWRDIRSGARHSVQMNTGTTLASYFPWNFNANYNEVWYLNSIDRNFDQANNRVVTDTISGFTSWRTFNISSSIETTLYNTQYFGTPDDGKLIQAVRHMVQPRIGMSYTPDFGREFWGYYNSYVDDQGQVVTYSRFENGIFGGPSTGMQTNIDFNLRNNLEMKIRDRASTEGNRKIKIFDFVNIDASYNLAADSMRLSPIRMNGATSFFDNKMRINFGATMDPYKVIVTEDYPNGIRINELGNFSINQYNVNLTYGLNNSTFSERQFNFQRRGNIRFEEFYFDDNNYAQFRIPWNLDFSLNHTRSQNLTSAVRTQTSLRLNGMISPTPHWRISGSTNLDLNTGELAYTQLSFSRDLRSFTIDFNWVPFGEYRTWNFFIAIRASFLRDAVKYEERNFNTRTSNF